MKSKCLTWCKEHRTFTVILVVEVLFLMIVFARSFAPRGEYDFEDMESGINETEEFYLAPGAYLIDVTYYGENYGDVDTSSVDILTYGVCRLQSYWHQREFTECSVNLAISKENIQARVWVKLNSKVDDAHFVVETGDNCTLTVESIHMVEQLRYRVVRFLAWLLLFAFFDFFWLVLIENIFRQDLQKRYTVGALLLICLVVNLPYFVNFQYHGHDFRLHLARIQSIAAELANGQFPVRMETGMLNGYGYASAIMYGNIFLYLPALLYLCMVPLGMSYQIYLVVVNALTCLVMYWVLRRMKLENYLALAGTVFYTFSAYRITNVYTRAAVGEYTAMVFFPLVIYGLWLLLSEEPRKYRLRDILPLVVGMTGIIQSHILSCEMLGIFLIFACLICFRRLLKKERLLALFSAAAITILLNLWFFVPFLQYYREDLRISEISAHNVQETGLYPAQIFGVFFRATGDNKYNGMYDEMGLTIGIALSLGILLSVAWRIRNGRPSGEKEKTAYLGLGLGLLALFMTTIYFPWNCLWNFNETIAKFACSIQFSWRYLGVATILLTFSLIFTLDLIRQKQPREAKICTAALLLAMALPTAMFFHEFENKSSENHYYSENENGTFFLEGREYILAGADTSQYHFINFLTEGDVQVTDYYRENGDLIFYCDNSEGEEAAVTAPIMNYPGYVAVDEETEELLETDTGENCRTRVEVPSGYEGYIRIHFAVPASWRASEAVSIVGLILLAALLVWEKKKQTVVLNRDNGKK